MDVAGNYLFYQSHLLAGIGEAEPHVSNSYLRWIKGPWVDRGDDVGKLTSLTHARFASTRLWV